jgi:hypothetical protein
MKVSGHLHTPATLARGKSFGGVLPQMSPLNQIISKLNDFLQFCSVLLFSFPVKKICFRFTVIWSSGDVLGLTPPNVFTQALTSCALQVAC